MRNAFLIVAAGGLMTGCTASRERSLEAEIQTIRTRVTAVESEITQHTPQISAEQAGIRTRVAYRPVQAWIASVNTAPDADRRITFRQTSRHGRIERQKINNPWPIPDGEWYVEIDNSTATKADLLIRRFELNADPTGLTLTTPLDFRVESRIHAHFDPGPGGGVGTNIFIDGDKRFDARFRLTFLPVIDGKLPYKLELIAPGSLKMTISAHLGGIGNYGHPFEMKNLARQLAEGTLDLLLDQSGELRPLPGGQGFTYRLRTSNPVFTPDGTGIVFASDVVAEVTPTGR